jgi:hypothetical protein
MAILRLARAPVHQNVFPAAREEALSVLRAPIDFVRCEDCGLLYNAAFDEALLRYDAGYEVDQSRSARFLSHLDDLCRRIEMRLPGPIDVVEVGCGQGTFLAHLARRLGDRLASAVGYDPAFRGEESLPDRVRIAARPFAPEEVARESLAPRLVVMRHVLEHVPAPVDFLRGVCAAFPEKRFDVLVETPDADHPLRNGIVYDLYYEHCSLHSAAALAHAMARAGLHGVSVERFFGDEYLLGWATTDARTIAAPSAPAGAGTDEARAFAARCASFASEWRERLVEARQRGGVALWGGAGKGVTFALLVDPDATLLDAVVDIHPSKEGRFVPGTGHPIVGPARAQALGVRTVVVMNDKYADEVELCCRAEAWDVDVWVASARARTIGEELPG